MLHLMPAKGPGSLHRMICQSENGFLRAYALDSGIKSQEPWQRMEERMEFENVLAARFVPSDTCCPIPVLHKPTDDKFPYIVAQRIYHQPDEQNHTHGLGFFQEFFRGFSAGNEFINDE